MKTIAIPVFLVLFFVSVYTQTQNLVSNGNFEDAHTDTVHRKYYVFEYDNIDGAALCPMVACAYWGKYSSVSIFHILSFHIIAISP